MEEPQEQVQRFGRAEVAGVRILGAFVSRQTVAVVLVVVLGLGGLLVTGGGDESPGLNIEAASAPEDAGDSIPEGDTTTTSGTDSTSTTVVSELTPTTVETSKTTGTAPTKGGGTSSTTVTTKMPAPTTTTPATSPPSTTVDTQPKQPVVVLEEDFTPAEHSGRRVTFRTADYRVPAGLKVHFRYRVKGGTKQFTAVFGQPHMLPDTRYTPSSERAFYEFGVSELEEEDRYSRYRDFFQGLVGWEWDGGSAAAPPAVMPQIKLTVVRADRCAAGENCYGYRFESDQALRNLTVYYRIKEKAGWSSSPGPAGYERMAYFDGTVSTTYYPAAHLEFAEGDPVPGLDAVTHVGWLGGSMSGDRVQICSTSTPC